MKTTIHHGHCMFVCTESSGVNIRAVVYIVKLLGCVIVVVRYGVLVVIVMVV